MRTADDQYYEVLRLAQATVDLHEKLDAAGLQSHPTSLYLSQALLDVEERRQLALGELGEVVMKDGPASHWHAERTADILAGRIEV